MTEKQSLLLSRRSLIRNLGLGAGALTLGVSLRPSLARAQVGPASVGVSALTRFDVGSFEVTIIQDGLLPFDPNVFGANAGEGEIAEILAGSNVPFENFVNTFNVTLVNTGSELVLLDSGLGAGAQANGGGKLIPSLELLGIAPEDIDAVVITHFHPDHVGGLATSGAASFPNATVFFPQLEYDFMQSAPADSPAAGVIAGATAALQPYMDAGSLAFYAHDTEILSGINSVSAIGHTPGHSAILLQSGEGQLLNVVDAILNQIVSVSRPDLVPGFDAIGEMAVATRNTLLGRAADEGLQVVGYHFAFPGLGYISRNEDSFRFTPAY